MSQKYKKGSKLCYQKIFLKSFICGLVLLSVEAFRVKQKRPKILASGIPRLCVDVQDTLRARRKSCFLRPDTGPCRAAILQWYFDVKQSKCYRFYWGGCQGNGNRFDSMVECIKSCRLDDYAVPRPQFCSLPFDYGTCFGYYNRWAWDRFFRYACELLWSLTYPLGRALMQWGRTYKSICKQRVYSGCGGNQNNFETRFQCEKTCMSPPNITRAKTRTTCFPVVVTTQKNNNK